MYLPTYWKLMHEASMFRMRTFCSVFLPVGFLSVWILYPSLYNWTYTSIIPPPSGVEKKSL